MAGVAFRGRHASCRTPAKSAGTTTMGSPSGPAARLFRGQPGPGADSTGKPRRNGEPPRIGDPADSAAVGGGLGILPCGPQPRVADARARRHVGVAQQLMQTAQRDAASLRHPVRARIGVVDMAGHKAFDPRRMGWRRDAATRHVPGQLHHPQIGRLCGTGPGGFMAAPGHINPARADRGRHRGMPCFADQAVAGLLSKAADPARSADCRKRPKPVHRLHRRSGRTAAAVCGMKAQQTPSDRERHRLARVTCPGGTLSRGPYRRAS